MLRAPVGERLRCLCARRALHRRQPAEKRALEPQRLAQPAAQIEAILVADDSSVAKYESRVDPVLDATFEFGDGLITRHVDRFSLWRWAAMALGAKGALLGWLPPVRAAIRARAAKGLAAYMAANP